MAVPSSGGARLFINTDGTRVSQNNYAMTATVARIDPLVDTIDDTTDLEWTVTYPGGFGSVSSLDSTTVNSDASDYALYDASGVAYSTNLVTLSGASISGGVVTVTATIPNDNTLDGAVYILGPSSTYNITSTYGTAAVNVMRVDVSSSDATIPTTAGGDITVRGQYAAMSGYTIDNKEPDIDTATRTSPRNSNSQTITFEVVIDSGHDASSITEADFAIGDASNANVRASTIATPVLKAGTTDTYIVTATLTDALAINADIITVTLLKSATFTITDNNGAQTTSSTTPVVINSDANEAHVSLNNHELGSTVAPTFSRTGGTSTDNTIGDASPFAWTLTYPDVTNISIDEDTLTDSEPDFELVDGAGQPLPTAIPLSVTIAGDVITVTAQNARNIFLQNQTVALSVASTFNIASNFGATVLQPTLPAPTTATAVYVVTNARLEGGRRGGRCEASNTLHTGAPTITDICRVTRHSDGSFSLRDDSIPELTTATTVTWLIEFARGTGVVNNGAPLAINGVANATITYEKLNAGENVSTNLNLASNIIIVTAVLPVTTSFTRTTRDIYFEIDDPSHFVSTGDVPPHTIATDVFQYISLPPLAIVGLCRGEVSVTESSNCANSEAQLTAGDRNVDGAVRAPLRRTWTITFSRTMDQTTVTENDFTITPSGTDFSISTVPPSAASSRQFHIRAEGIRPEQDITLGLASTASFSDNESTPESFEPDTFPTGAQTTVRIDNVIPRVTAVTRSTPTDSSIGAATTEVIWEVEFSENIDTNSIDETDFELAGAGFTSGDISDVTQGTDATTWLVTANSIVANGVLRLGLADNATIADVATNQVDPAIITQFEATGAIYTVDQAPTVTSIIRATTSGTELPETTSLPTLRWIATFSEPVTGLDTTGGIVVTGATGPALDATDIGNNAWLIEISQFTATGTPSIISFTLAPTIVGDGTNDLNLTGAPDAATYQYSYTANVAPSLTAVKRTTTNNATNHTREDSSLSWNLFFTASIDPASLVPEDFRTLVDDVVEVAGDITVESIDDIDNTVFSVTLALTGDQNGKKISIENIPADTTVTPAIEAATFEYADDSSDTTSRAAVALVVDDADTSYNIDTKAPIFESFIRTSNVSRQMMLDTTTDLSLSWTITFDEEINASLIDNESFEVSFLSSDGTVTAITSDGLDFVLTVDCSTNPICTIVAVSAAANLTNLMELLSQSPEFILQIPQESESDFADTTGNPVITDATRASFNSQARFARYSIDDGSPTVTSFIRSSQPSSPDTLITSSRAISWRIGFSEQVTSLDASDFVLNTVTTDDSTTPPTVTRAAYTDATPTISLIGTTATITAAFPMNVNLSTPTELELSLATGFSVTDTAGNAIDTTADPLPDAPSTYTVRHVSPTPTVSILSNTTADETTFTAHSGEIVRGMEPAIRIVITYDLPIVSGIPDFEFVNEYIDGATIPQLEANTENTEFTIEIPVASILHNGDLTFRLSDATDSYGNIYRNFQHRANRIDLNTDPTIVSVTRAGEGSTITNLERIVWELTFSERVDDVEPRDFRITLDRAAPATDIVYIPNLIGATDNQVYLLSLDTSASITPAANPVVPVTLADLSGELTVTWHDDAANTADTTDISDASNNDLDGTTVDDTSWETYTVDNTSTVVATQVPILTIETSVSTRGASRSPTGVQAAPAVGQNRSADPAPVGVNGAVQITVRSNVPLMAAPDLEIAGFTTQPTLAVVPNTDDRVWQSTVSITDSEPTSDGPLAITVSNYESAAATAVEGTPVEVMTTLATMNPNLRSLPVGAITITRDARIAAISRVDSEMRGFADELVWDILFSSDVRNVDEGDFCVMSGGNCTTYTISEVTTVNLSTYRVRAIPSNDVVASGAVSLSLVASHDVVSLATNAQAVMASPTGAESYIIDSSTPNVGLTTTTRPLVPVPDVARTYVANRVAQLIASLPDLADRLKSRLAGSGPSSNYYSATIDNKTKNLELGFFSDNSLNNLDDNFWGTLVYTSGSTDTSDSDSLIVNLGVDKFITKDSLFGIFFTYDDSSIENAQSETISGTGWLAGPYYATTLPNSMKFTGRAGIGESTNEGTLANGDRFEFDTERVILNAELSGQMSLSDDWDLFPEVSYSYFSSERVDNSSTYELNRLEFGPRFEYEDSNLSPTFGVLGVWNFTDNELVSEDELSLRLDASISMRGSGDTHFNLDGYYDGVGADFETYGISLGLSIPY